jgi:hypothetical protein
MMPMADAADTYLYSRLHKYSRILYSRTQVPTLYVLILIYSTTCIRGRSTDLLLALSGPHERFANCPASSSRKFLAPSFSPLAKKVAAKLLWQTATG